MSKKQVLKPLDAIKIARALIKDQYKEHFIGIYLNSRNKAIKVEVVTMGILDASIVHPREVYRPAILNHSSAIIILHNHPSGIADPSEADKDLTQRLIKAGNILGIKILDHIIFAGVKKYFSFSDEGLI